MLVSNQETGEQKSSDDEAKPKRRLNENEAMWGLSAGLLLEGHSSLTLEEWVEG